jgi:predicted TIM-barrel fold metal-dependent hydrolase
MRLRRPLGPVAERLFEYSGTIPIIDTHEHIPIREEFYVGSDIRFGNLFNPYVSNDLKSAGMPFPPEVWAALHVIADDWEAFEPYWKRVKHGSYARALRIGFAEFFGMDDITRENWRDLVAAVNANRKPGVYRRVLRERCNIAWSVVCASHLPDHDDPLLKGNIASPANLARNPAELARMEIELEHPSLGLSELIGKCAGQPKPRMRNLAAFEEVAERWMELQKAKGAIEFKVGTTAYEAGERAKAAMAFEAVLRGEPVPRDEGEHLDAYLRDFVAKQCARLDLPLAVHTGVWGDFRGNSVNNIIRLVMENPATRFDIYHMSIPHVRESLLVAKNFPNAFMNLCWSHIVAPEMVTQSMIEGFDLVPTNKTFAFGADYSLAIEKVYGHLWIARENVSRALAHQVEAGRIDEGEARAILKAWFHDNPKEFYRI